MTTLDTYTNLKTFLAGWLVRDNLSDRVGEAIALFEPKLRAILVSMTPPHRSLEQNTTGTLAATIALPTGFISTKRLRVTTSGDERTLDYIPYEEAGKYGSTGRSMYYTVYGSNVLPIPPPGTAEAYSWDYLKALDPLSDSVATNWVLTNAPNVYVFGSLLELVKHLKQGLDRIDIWKGSFAEAVALLELENQRNRMGAGRLVMRSDAAPCG